MYNYTKHFINGEWVDSSDNETIDVFNPATEAKIGTISAGTKDDLDKAVKAAKEAFPTFSQTTRKERIKWLTDIAREYEKRKDDFIKVITEELGSPVSFTEETQYAMGLNHFKATAEVLKNFQFTEEREEAFIQKEAIGVAGLITPWNFPTNQVATKLASAFAAGSTVVLKPATETPFAAMLLAEVIEKAGIPNGVFNLVTGTGSTIGDGISSHPEIDFVSFTGSGNVGTKIMQNAAEDIKDIALELGGKSPIIVLADADIEEAARTALANIATNTGQVCTAGTRIFIPKDMHDAFADKVKALLPDYPIGDPNHANTFMGPQVSKEQWQTVQDYIQAGIDTGAELIIGGTGKPDGLDTGYYSKITMFTHVDHNSKIAQEEIFGPVMTVFTYQDLDEALELANTTIYGLAGYVVGKDRDTLIKVAQAIRAGRITINGGGTDFTAPFGGYKQSGIGREWGDFGIDEFLETKTILGMPN
ncbi:aldehyde dehydrogenase (NAD+) [Amphibacillus marinus]|uniref:aldehyde dehydrogenase (NAD(+)) n=1 Tax=Amphibacillus marinus TaxID=872970 RepID=A0A1H8PQE6_9BACI|nr:aldehyde dehydrogenase family protein [Amphibacillus marinus]SEO43918.1 aldehyde dehydrogenase (NAD+) [Amphibacillus marinus]